MAIEHVRHRLAVAVHFTDIFTSRPIAAPLDVRIDTLPIVAGMPRMPWRAVRGPNDQTYRFLVTNETVMPAGTLTVVVTSPNHEYASFEAFEPFTVTLPRPLAHPPTPARSDYLIARPLWPTRSLRLPPGETAILGRLVSAGATPTAGLKVTIWRDGTSMPATPYTYSNNAGEFVFRLPGLKSVNGGTVSTTAPLLIDLRLPPTHGVAVVPSQVLTDAGVVLGTPASVPLGRVTNLTISLP
jgi:hypothetical protein